MDLKQIGLRWTIGDVSQSGFEALQVSICSAWNLFKDRADYTVCVNTIALDDARRQTGALPPGVRWLDVGTRVPDWLNRHVDKQMAEGVAWKFAPVRLYPGRFELALDNDVILWDIPQAMQWWLDEGDGCLLAEDVQRCLGQFSECNCGPVNSGIRGIPPGFDLEARLREALGDTVLRSETDEQGLQAAALSKSKLYMVSTGDVTICSPFPGHQHHLGRCGVHLVGLNAKRSPWILGGRWAHEAVRENWQGLHQSVIARAGTPC